MLHYGARQGTPECSLPTMQGAIELPSEEEMRNQIAKQHELNRRSFAQIERLALLVMLVRPCIPLHSEMH